MEIFLLNKKDKFHKIYIYIYIYHSDGDRCITIIYLECHYSYAQVKDVNSSHLQPFFVHKKNDKFLILYSLIYICTKQKGQKLVFWNRTILDIIFFQNWFHKCIKNVNLSLIPIGTITNTNFFFFFLSIF